MGEEERKRFNSKICSQPILYYYHFTSYLLTDKKLQGYNKL